MRIGIPREIKDHEYRVSILPAGVRSLIRAGHTVLVEKDAGKESGIPDDEYTKAGALIRETAGEIYGESEMVVKVKEPISVEYPLLREGQVVFTFLHLAANPSLTDTLLSRGVTAIAYETVEEKGTLPLLIPMSEVAGRMSVFMGAHYLQKTDGGKGILLGGVPGVPPARVLVLGAGTVGRNAVYIAAGMGAQVIVMNRWLTPLRDLDAHYRGRVTTTAMNEQTIEEEASQADLIIGAVLVPGAKAPALIGRSLLSRMKRGSVIVDVSIDQGGCVETSRPTTHSDPVYEVDGIIHYCVTNIPGIVPRTSTYALCNATIPYIRKMADLGVERALMEDQGLRQGMNTHRGGICHRSVAEAMNRPWTPYH